MNAEQWRQVKEVCITALALVPQQRKAFVEEVCHEDWLLSEVESLLSFEARAQEQLNELSPEFVAAALNRDERLIGSKIGNYLLHSLLGRGGMGEVYLAQDTDLGRKVALKILPKEFTLDEQPLQRFRQEARAASGLKHRNIITIYSVGQDDGLYFIATEYVPGLTLRQRLIAAGRLELCVAVDIASQIASALEAAHGAGIVHRDVKPENIMFEPDGTVKLLDFGIAKLTENVSATIDADAELPKTEQGVILGTPAYMSPEQARHQALDHRSDLFSLGVVLYEMVTGKVPFSGGTPYDQQAAVLVSDPTPLRQHLDNVSPELRWVISKALMKEPRSRYQTATDLLIDLRRLSQSLENQEHRSTQEQIITPETASINIDPNPSAGIPVRDAVKPWLRTRRSAVVTVSLLVVTCILAAVIWLTGRGPKLAASLGLHGPAPVIESIVPNRPIDIIGDQPIEVRGRHFQDGLRLKVGFPNGESNELSGAQIRKPAGKTTSFEILIDFNGNPGTYTFQLLNPDGQMSPSFSFEARHETQRPVIDWIEPKNPTTSGGEQSVAVYGHNFQIGVRVEVIQPNGNTSELRDRQIVDRTPNSFHALFFFHLAGKHSIRAVNPNGGKSDYFDIMVQ